MYKKIKIFPLIIIGGGAAGMFAACQIALQKAFPDILILEKSKNLLSKVKISGGGRCNVTHACWEPDTLIDAYPRGNKELLGPFHHFMCGDMIGWLNDHGVPTKIEEDGRIFPSSNDSQSIIDCFEDIVAKNKIPINKQCGVKALSLEKNIWKVETLNDYYHTKNILVATGSSPQMWKIMQKLTIPLVSAVPSLFTFNIKHAILEGVPGLSMPSAHVKIAGTHHVSSGPILITHWGLSGPAILKLSAWAARMLFDKNYKFEISVNWIDENFDSVFAFLKIQKQNNGKQKLAQRPLYQIPKRLWKKLLIASGIQEQNSADLSLKQMDALAKVLTNCKFVVNGKSTFKEEFVTAGGIDSKAINWKTMQSKQYKNLYFAGEIINVDALTGGYNFQAAWTTATLAANAIVKNLEG